MDGMVLGIKRLGYGVETTRVDGLKIATKRPRAGSLGNEMSFSRCSCCYIIKV